MREKLLSESLSESLSETRISDDSKVMQEESNGEVDYDQGPREYIDSSLGTIRDIKIQQLNSGYLITVGCQTIAIETASKLSSALNSYIMSPREFERKWFSVEKVNKLENI